MHCKQLNTLLLVIFAAHIACSCEDDISPVVSNISNFSQLKESFKGGAIVNFDIWAKAEKGTLGSMCLESYDTEYGNRMILDTLLSGKEQMFSYYYRLPSFNSDSIIQTISLNVCNSLGDVSSHKYKIRIAGGINNLPEFTGLQLFAGNSGKANAFQLSDPTQTYILDPADSTRLADVYAYSCPDDNNRLSREWRTQTSTYFFKYNDFDYPNANTRNVEAIYNSSHRYKSVSDIQEGDIIFVGKEDKVWGVILVTLCYDNDGTANDGYLMNYKIVQ